MESSDDRRIARRRPAGHGRHRPGTRAARGDAESADSAESAESAERGENADADDAAEAAVTIDPDDVRFAGDRFRRMILSRGATIDYEDAFWMFRGQQRSVEPLLRRRGLSGSVH